MSDTLYEEVWRATWNGLLFKGILVPTSSRIYNNCGHIRPRECARTSSPQQSEVRDGPKGG